MNANDGTMLRPMLRVGGFMRSIFEDEEIKTSRLEVSKLNVTPRQTYTLIDL